MHPCIPPLATPLSPEVAPFVLGFNTSTPMYQPTNSTILQGIFPPSARIQQCFGQIHTAHAQELLFMSTQSSRIVSATAISYTWLEKLIPILVSNCMYYAFCFETTARQRPNLGQILHFLTSYKIWGGMAEKFESKRSIVGAPSVLDFRHGGPVRN